MPDPKSLTREELLVWVRDLLLINEEQQARIQLLEQDVARLRGGSGPSSGPKELPYFVKPNRTPKEQPKKPRKRRSHGFARRREEPTQVVEHFPASCSRCGRKFGEGGWVHASRQIIEIPRMPIEVIEHRFMARRCGVCGQRELARPDLSGEALGQSRLGVGVMSLIAYLDTVCRMPIRTIERLLEGLYGLHVSEGKIVEVLHRVAGAGESTYEGLLETLCRSRVVKADETGAREEGTNGYVWALTNEDTRYYHRDKSRGAWVIQELLGYDPEVYQARSARGVREARGAQRETEPKKKRTRFHGGLVSDFYSAYSWYPGPHQRCLVHLDRDLDELKAAHPDDPAVGAWVERVLDLIERAKDYAGRQQEQPTDNGLRRARRRQALEREAEELARPYAKSALPQRVLAERILKHRHQLFVFVEHKEVPADNNAAERSIRPFVVLRKVSGGTRSAKGSRTQAVLLSLFGTWLLRGQDALAACQQMLGGGAVPAPT
jgi:transposase